MGQGNNPSLAISTSLLLVWVCTHLHTHTNAKTTLNWPFPIFLLSSSMRMVFGPDTVSQFIHYLLIIFIMVISLNVFISCPSFKSYWPIPRPSKGIWGYNCESGHKNLGEVITACCCLDAWGCAYMFLNLFWSFPTMILYIGLKGMRLYFLFI